MYRKKSNPEKQSSVERSCRVRKTGLLNYTIPDMHKTLRSGIVLSVVVLLLASACFGSAYNGRPKLVVIIVVDQLRGDYLERYRDQLGPNGFRLLMDHGANFTECYYDYAITMTAPGHATLGTGAYSDGHGIGNNEWWDSARKKVVTSVQDDSVRIVGAASDEDGASPHNLLADTLADELKLATGGKARAFGVSLKDRAAILPVGFSANGAFWLEHKSGRFVTSSYYMKQLPEWAEKFDSSNRADKYWDLEWKDGNGKVLRTTKRTNEKGKQLNFYDVVGITPFANDYQIEFVRDLITNEKLGLGPSTDLLVVSISSYDILGHKVGPDSPEMLAMTLALDKQLGDFFSFLGRQVGLANTWIALSADHGAAPMPEVAQSMHIPAARFDEKTLAASLNKELATKLGKPGDYVKSVAWPSIYLSGDTFSTANLKEADAEKMVGEAVVRLGIARDFFTKAQVSTGSVPPTQLGRRYLHSYMPYGGWYVMAVPPLFLSPYPEQTEHYSPYNYNTHVPLLFFGLPFQPGTYRTHTEPVDLATTLASLLGINKPTHAVGRVLTEALAPAQAAPSSATQSVEKPNER
ncbi:MAG: type phosphodiesterase/nucleotide pyrophosphatase [Acidobacteriales bacterium]|nr:type phosphodiesterase/nucleotide pyrophosphatase [Terriglobales bacterium]